MRGWLLIEQAHLHCTEEQGVLVSGMVRGQVVEIEYTYLEHSVVGTHTHVGYQTDGEQLHGKIIPHCM